MQESFAGAIPQHGHLCEVIIKSGKLSKNLIFKPVVFIPTFIEYILLVKLKYIN